MNKENIALYDSINANDDYLYPNYKVVYELKNYCNENNLNDYIVYIDEVNNRHDLNSRPMYQLLCKDIKQNKIKKVIIGKLERLSRNTEQNLKFLTLLKNHNCQIICLDGRDLMHYKTIVDSYLQYKKQKTKEELER